MVTDGSEATTHRTRVFVTDGHASYRDGMARLLGDHPAVDVVGEADAWAIALLGKETPPGALVADLVAAGPGRVARPVE
jgi:DNA-binding NarL/FixJ family response regulator